MPQGAGEQPAEGKKFEWALQAEATYLRAPIAGEGGQGHHDHCQVRAEAEAASCPGPPSTHQATFRQPEVHANSGWRSVAGDVKPSLTAL